MKLQRGDLFSRTKIADDRTRIVAFYQDRGYANVNVVAHTKLDLDHRTVALTFEVIPGAVTYIESIVVVR